MSLRVLIIDDSLLFRKTLSDVLAQIPEVEIIGTAPNGKIALEKIEQLTPDLITLDIDMPDINGIQVLEELRKKPAAPGVIILTGTSPAGGTVAMKALELGAFDFVPKPASDSIEDGRKALFSSIQPIIQAFIGRSGIRTILSQDDHQSVLGRPQEKPPLTPTSDVALSRRQKSWGNAELIVIGISTGGPQALHRIFSLIREPLPIPMLIVQHIPAFFSAALAASLRSKHHLPIHEAMGGEILEPGKVFIAPGGKHMKIRKSEATHQFQVSVTDDRPENNCKPSIDYLLRSVAHHFPGKTAVFIMTGMGSDGATGAALVKRAGGVVFAQDEKSSVVFGMPKAVLESKVADHVISLDLIASKILELAGNR